jgi:hypothetical protein
MTTAPTPAPITNPAGEGAANVTAAPATPAVATPPPVAATPAAAPADAQAPAAAAPAAPETPAKVEGSPNDSAQIKLELSDDLLLDDADIERIEAEVKAQGLNKDQAQALLNNANNAVKRFVDAQVKEHEAVKEKWLGEIAKDKEIGGDDYKKNIELSHRVMKRFGSERLVTELERTGLGNQPELVRLLTRIGRSMSEDTLIIPGSNDGAKPKDAASVLYPTTT